MRRALYPIGPLVATRVQLKMVTFQYRAVKSSASSYRRGVLFTLSDVCDAVFLQLDS